MQKLSCFTILIFFNVFFLKAQQIDFCLSKDATAEIIPSLKDTTTSRGTMDLSKTWQAGTTLKIKFLNGDSFLRRKVLQYAEEWTNYGNIHFESKQNGPAEIRVKFDSTKGNDSPIGIDAANFQSQAIATTNFNFTPYTDERIIKRHVLHEFGHMLGLLHENSSPVAQIDWDKDTIYAFYKATQGWGKKQVDENVFKTYSKTCSNGQFDDQSIMCYSIPAFFTKSKKEIIGTNLELSSGDKDVISKMYPKNKVENQEEEPRVKSTILIKEIAVKNQVFTIKPAFELLNGNGYTFKMVAYFFDEKDKPLMDAESSNRSQDGQLIALAKVQPCCKTVAFNATASNPLLLNVDTHKISLPKGSKKLKMQLVLWSGKSKIYASQKFEFSAT